MSVPTFPEVIKHSNMQVIFPRIFRCELKEEELQQSQLVLVLVKGLFPNTRTGRPLGMKLSGQRLEKPAKIDLFAFLAKIQIHYKPGVGPSGVCDFKRYSQSSKVQRHDKFHFSIVRLSCRFVALLARGIEQQQNWASGIFTARPT